MITNPNYGQQTVPIPAGYKLVPDATGYRLIPDAQDSRWQEQRRYNSLQEATRDAITSGLPGRMVTNPEEVRPNEVPSDGTIAYFPSSDLQTIIAKQVSSNGMIVEAKYVLESKQETSAQNVSVDLGPVNERLTKIEAVLTRLQNIWEPVGEKPAQEG